MENVNEILKSGSARFSGVDVVDFVIVMGAIFFGLIIFHWIAQNLPNKFSGSVKRFGKYYRYLVMILFYGLILVIVLNAIINKQYSNLSVLLFLIIAPKLHKWYSAYDRYVDQKA